MWYYNLKMSLQNVEIIKLSPDFSHPTAGKELIAAYEVLHLTTSPLFEDYQVCMTIGEISCGVANALRRAICDEVPSLCLTFDSHDFNYQASTDLFMSESFVKHRLNLIPIKLTTLFPHVPNIKFKLHVMNPDCVPKTVYSRDLEPLEASDEELFLPDHTLLILQPGCSIFINNIHFVTGTGRDHAAYNVGIRCRAIPLDIPKVDHVNTHGPHGTHQDQSGYSQSSLLSYPQTFQITTILSSMPSAHSPIIIMQELCEILIQRLQAVADKVSNNITFIPSTCGDNVLKMCIEDETETLGGSITDGVRELYPTIPYVASTNKMHECLTIVLKTTSPKKEMITMLHRGIQRVQDKMASIKKDLQNY